MTACFIMEAPDTTRIATKGTELERKTVENTEDRDRNHVPDWAQWAHGDYSYG